MFRIMTMMKMKERKIAALMMNTLQSNMPKQKDIRNHILYHLILFAVTVIYIVFVLLVAAFVCFKVSFISCCYELFQKIDLISIGFTNC